MSILDDINKKFSTVRKVGSDGEKLVNSLDLLIKELDFIINEFELGMKSETWVNNFSSIGGVELLKWSQDIYMKLKETREYLKTQGL